MPYHSVEAARLEGASNTALRNGAGVSWHGCLCRCSAWRVAARDLTVREHH